MSNKKSALAVGEIGAFAVVIIVSFLVFIFFIGCGVKKNQQDFEDLVLPQYEIGVIKSLNYFLESPVLVLGEGTDTNVELKKVYEIIVESVEVIYESEDSDRYDEFVALDNTIGITDYFSNIYGNWKLTISSEIISNEYPLVKGIQNYLLAKADTKLLIKQGSTDIGFIYIVLEVYPELK